MTKWNEEQIGSDRIGNGDSGAGDRKLVGID